MVSEIDGTGLYRKNIRLFLWRNDADKFMREHYDKSYNLVPMVIEQ
jgi:hypothetical protein